METHAAKIIRTIRQGGRQGMFFFFFCGLLTTEEKRLSAMAHVKDKHQQ